MATGADLSGPTTPPVGRAVIVGLGLIGGSVGLRLRREGWVVGGTDRDEALVGKAIELGVIDAPAVKVAPDIVVISVPVSSVAAEARQWLDESKAVVTDVGSVKSHIVDAVKHERFVGGHPMAGSEQDGLDGADAEMFDGATWVLTPSTMSTNEALAAVRALVTTLGARPLIEDPIAHDGIVATVSHVPHLLAAALMRSAVRGGRRNDDVLRLAAGGFRDMTRVASGRPDIWLDICRENRVAILAALDELTSSLDDVRTLIDEQELVGLAHYLAEAREARRLLPGPVRSGNELAEIRVPVLDRPGVLAELTTIAQRELVNVGDLSIAHSSEGDHGVITMLVDRDGAERLAVAYRSVGYRPTFRDFR